MRECDLLKRVISPYISECRYLKEASLDYPVARGRFEIPKPFYCVQTGHFNAVEAMICYNQLAYFMFASFSQKGMIDSVGEVSFEEFKDLQASRTYITKINRLVFKKPINPINFEGKITLENSSKRGNYFFFDTSFGFGNDFSAKSAFGSILLAACLEKRV